MAWWLVGELKASSSSTLRALHPLRPLYIFTAQTPETDVEFATAIRARFNSDGSRRKRAAR